MGGLGVLVPHGEWRIHLLAVVFGRVDGDGELVDVAQGSLISFVGQDVADHYHARCRFGHFTQKDGELLESVRAVRGRLDRVTFDVARTGTRRKGVEVVGEAPVADCSSIATDDDDGGVQPSKA